MPGYHVLFRFMINFGTSKKEYERKIYGFLDVLGDYGGVAEVLTTSAASLLGSISAHNYIIKAVAALFFAKTTDSRLFADKKSNKAQKKLKAKDILRKSGSMNR